MSEKKQDATNKSSPDPTKALREMYDQFWKQASDQWDQVLRNPHFLTAMATYIEQSQGMTARVQEMVAAALKRMNIPTEEDLRALNQRLDELSAQVTEVSRQLNARAAASTTRKKPVKKAAGKRAGRRA